MAQNYSEEIAQLEQLINSARRDVSTDGLRTGFDLEHATKRLAELRRLHNGTDRSMVRPIVSTLNLGGCF